MTTINKVRCEYVTETKYDSFMFKVYSYQDSPDVQKFMKDYEDSKFLYVKKKLLEPHTDKFTTKTYWRLSLKPSKYTNNEGQEITFIESVPVIKKLRERPKLTDKCRVKVPPILEEDSSDEEDEEEEKCED